MKKVAVGFIIGSIAGIPLTALLGPVGAIITIFLVSFIVSASSSSEKKKAQARPQSTRLSKDDEELITVILPTILRK